VLAVRRRTGDHRRHADAQSAPAMKDKALSDAVALLVEARPSGVLLGGLPVSCRPHDVGEAHAIQDATVAALGETVAGWKVGAREDGKVVRGVLLASRVLKSGDTIAAATVPLLGIEAEIAFRFDHDLPARDRAYSYDEVVSAVTAFPAIEIVDSRYRDYANAPLLERIADFVSNGAFVCGAMQPRWRDVDLAQLEASLAIDGNVVVKRAGGHPAGDPLRPAVDLVNDLRLEHGVRAGQLMTTGTCTGIHFAKPGQRAKAAFDGFGIVEIELR
jgi:2-keto-4-pentenoate hydratase